MTTAAELIVLVDESGNPIGEAEKLLSHHSHTPLHLAFSCYVFNKHGDLLVTRRATGKKVWPGVWTNSVCGHPAPGESMMAAIERRLQYELGMTATDFSLVLPNYRYVTPAMDDVIENEFCPVFVARASSAVAPNPDEVESYKWLSWTDFVAACQADKIGEYSWWCKDQLKLLQQEALITRYSSK